MFQKLLSKYWPFILITFVVFAFHIRLFFPEPSIYVTPDFGRSDILHINLPAKLLLSQALKKFEFPLWEPNIGQGIPIMAEGVIGAFYIQNIIIFGLLPFKHAIPVNYLLTFIIAALGVYALARFYKFSKYIGTISAISYTLCASMVLHVQHINLIEAASILPWCLLALLNLEKRQNLRSIVIVSLIFSQLFAAGFVQIYFYAFILFGTFIIIVNWFNKKKRIFKTFILICLCLVFSLSICAIQLLPSAELLTQSRRQQGIQSTEILDAFPLTPKNFLTYINPYILGKAKDGTYNSTDWGKYGIYWENTGYIGLLPFIFAFYGFLHSFSKRKKTFLIAIILAIFISTLFSLGKFSPLHIFFSLPPLNFFRVPARFILFTQLFLVLLAAFGIKQLINYIPKKFLCIFYYFIITITVFDLFYYWWNYNPTAPISFWADKPQTTSTISTTDNERIYSIGSPRYWNEVFVKKGWTSNLDEFKFFLNSQDPNLNIAYNNSQLAMFETLPTRRYLVQQTFLKNEIKLTEGKINIDDKTKNLLDFNSVKYLISTYPIENQNYKLTLNVQKKDYSYYVYESSSSNPRFSMYYDWKQISTLTDYDKFIKAENAEETILLEKDIEKHFTKSSNEVSVDKLSNSYIRISVKTDNPGILVSTDAYYPGWEAKIDSNYTEIYAANINSRAIIIPAGTHTVEFQYRPKSVIIGGLITIISLLASVFILFRKRL